MNVNRIAGYREGCRTVESMSWPYTNGVAVMLPIGWFLPVAPGRLEPTELQAGPHPKRNMTTAVYGTGCLKGTGQANGPTGRVLHPCLACPCPGWGRSTSSDI